MRCVCLSASDHINTKTRLIRTNGTKFDQNKANILGVEKPDNIHMVFHGIRTRKERPVT
jgi:hypothetical protein